MEYASADAVRRGGGGGPKNVKQDQHGKRGRVQQYGEEKGTNPSSKHDTHRPKGDREADTLEESTVEPTVTPGPLERRKRTRDDHSHKKRAQPGAALAQAPRQSAAIVPSEGRKIVF